MPILLALLLATPFPSASKTSWMRLESFRLTIGMARYDAAKAVAMWGPKVGKDLDEIVVDHSGDKALTLEFRNDRLHSVRFELYAQRPEIRKAFDEERKHLRKARGTPRKSTSAILIYDNALPNVIVAITEKPNAPSVLAVRYFDPR